MATTIHPAVADGDPLEHRPSPARPRRAPDADRAPGELDQRHRDALADRVRALGRPTAAPRRCDTGPQRAHRAQVLAAQGRLSDVEAALRSGIPLRRRGELLVERLLAHDAVGTYAQGDLRALHDDADAACAALGVRTPFH